MSDKAWTPDGLTARQEKFCQLVASGLPMSKSYIGAGYSSDQAMSTIYTNATNLAKDPKIVKRVNHLLEPEVDIPKLVTRELLAIATQTPKGKPGYGDKNRSLELLARSHGMFLDRVQVAGHVEHTLGQLSQVTTDDLEAIAEAPDVKMLSDQP